MQELWLDGQNKTTNYLLPTCKQSWCPMKVFVSRNSKTEHFSTPKIWILRIIAWKIKQWSVCRQQVQMEKEKLLPQSPSRLCWSWGSLVILWNMAWWTGVVSLFQNWPFKYAKHDATVVSSLVSISFSMTAFVWNVLHIWTWDWDLTGEHLPWSSWCLFTGCSGMYGPRVCIDTGLLFRSSAAEMSSQLLLSTWLNSSKFTNWSTSYALLLILPFFVFILCTCTCLVRYLFLMLHCLSGTVSLAKLDHQTHSHLSNHFWNLTS